MEKAASSAASIPQPDSSARVCYLASLRFVAKFYLPISFLPMILVMVLGNIQLVIVFTICVALVLSFLGFSRLCYNAGIFQVSSDRVMPFTLAFKGGRCVADAGLDARLGGGTGANAGAQARD